MSAQDPREGRHDLGGDALGPAVVPAPLSGRRGPRGLGLLPYRQLASPRSTIARRLLAVGGTAFAVFVLLPASRTTPQRVVALTVLAYGVVRMRRALGGVVRPRLSADPVQALLGPPSELDVRLARLRASLAFASESHDGFERSTRPLLQRLVADRLARHHGIDLVADPVAARARTGDELWQLFDATDLSRPGTSPRGDRLGPPPERLAHLVALAGAL